MTLAAHNFCRIHHGVMINIQFVKSYMKGKGGYVIMKDGTELTISQRRKGDFLKCYVNGNRLIVQKLDTDSLTQEE